MAAARLGFQSNSRPLLARIRAYRSNSVFIKNRFHDLGVGGEHKWMALFTLFACIWSFGWFVYLVGNDLEIHRIRVAFHFRVSMCGSVFPGECWNYWDGGSEFTDAWRSGGSVMNELFELAMRSGNWGVVAFGLAGMAIAGFFGFLLKQPLIRQGIHNEQFKATIEGYKNLTDSQSSRITYLESQMSIRDEYEAILIKRLRECEERHMLGRLE